MNSVTATEEKNKISGADSPNPVATPVEPAAASPDCNSPKKRTLGNKLFDWGVYSTIAWGGVAALGLVLGHEANHGSNKMFSWIRSLNKNLSHGINHGLKNTLYRNSPEKARAWAESGSLWAILSLGGTGLMPLIKYMEDNRLKLSAKIDRALGTTPPDGESIAHEPKQTWKSVLSGRTMAIGFSLMTFVGMGPKVSRTASQWAGEKFANGWMRLSPKSNAASVRRWADIFAFDAVLTSVTALVTYAISRIVAKQDEQATDAEDVMMTIDPSTPTPLHPVHTPQAKPCPPEKQVEKARLKPAAAYVEKIAPQPATFAQGL